ncbi:hypothetical protein [Sphaerisporangium corydalis]|uniref:Uncharacterized protein n=1 Tax=Sphaerisporangium corydalis TaxID=1441875 RepID=A0ABV9ENA0_9ACTN|nr:hypothetical protein [Sphaerisporangium corydalis]
MPNDSALRAVYEMSRRRLARQGGDLAQHDHQSRTRERHPRRPLPSSLALDPDEHLRVLELLVMAAGPSLRAETLTRTAASGSWRRSSRALSPSRPRAMALHQRRGPGG